MKKQTIIDEYLTYENLYSNKYDKYVLFYQNGSFFEIFSIDPDGKKIKEICHILNIQLTKKNKSISIVNKSNYFMAGIPVCAFEKHLDKLINNNYTVITYIQYIENGVIKRKFDNIYSIGTYIDNNRLNDYYNNITSIYIDKYKNNLTIGCSTLDVTIGKNNVYEFYIDINKEENKLFEELMRYIITNNPKEIIYISNNYENNDLIKFLKDKTIIFHSDNSLFNKEYENINYQNDFLNKIFSSTILTPIEIIHMEKYQTALISYIILLQFAYNYNNLIINNIKLPDIITDYNSLLLHNNALHQLDIIPKNNHNKKYDSLLNTINFTLTPLGNRLLKYNLTNPITNINELNKRYLFIDTIKKSHNYLKYKQYLEKIIDIERYHKKLSLSKLQPFNYTKCNESYENIINLINLTKLDFKEFNYDNLNKFKEYYKEYLYYFNIHEMELSSFNTLNLNTFNKQVFPELDIIYYNIEKDIQWIDELCNELTKLANKNIIEYIHTDRDGYFLKATKKRANILKENTKDHMLYKDLVYDTKNKSSTYIYYDKLKIKSNNIINNQDKLKKLIYEKYIDTCEFLYHKYSHILFDIHEFISIIDVSYSNSILARTFNYSMPIIDTSKNESFINCEQLRHPIIEQLLEDVPYISSEVNYLGYNDKNGVLLYGINGAGKCFKKNTKIIMFDGTTKSVQNINIGDQVMGDDSTPRNILSLAQGIDTLYEISNKHGDVYTVNKEHILCLISSMKPNIIDIGKSWVLQWFDTTNLEIKNLSMAYSNNNKKTIKQEMEFEKMKIEKKSLYFTISVKKYLNLPKICYTFLSGYKTDIKFKEKKVNIDPYIIGLWLGDCTSNKCQFTTQNLTIKKYLTEKYQYNLILQQLKLLNHKHIPNIYKYNSRKIRLKLLAGLIDSGGYLYKNTYEFLHKNNIIMNDVIYLCRSLGFNCYKNNDITWLIHISGNMLDEIPVLCPQKIIKNKMIKNQFDLTGVINVKEIGIDNYYGFETDGNHKFLLDNFIVTHNSAQMKAIGQNIILAQAGCYVSGQNFKYYPFTNIFTRINKHDDLFRGRSSFMVEIYELNSIFKFANKNSLVLGDEIMSTTENISALSIICASINYFLKNNVKFIFASHIHNISKYINKNEINKLYIGHLHTKIIDNKIIYERKLKDGIGEINYGIQVMKTIFKDDDAFVKDAFNIQNKLLQNSNKILNIKKSKYNSKQFIDHCYLCKDINNIINNLNIDIHHIQFQCTYGDTKLLNNIKIHSKTNLVPLCKLHHESVHKTEIIIHGWLETSLGRELNYTYN